MKRAGTPRTSVNDESESQAVRGAQRELTTFGVKPAQEIEVAVQPARLEISAKRNFAERSDEHKASQRLDLQFELGSAFGIWFVKSHSET
jgi:hypothetical protein